MGVNKSNFIVRSVAPMSLFESVDPELLGTETYDQGEHLMLDLGSDTIKHPAAETDSATYLGISRATIVAGKPKQPYTTDVDASQSGTDIGGPQTGIVVLLEAKGADNFVRGAKVGLDAANLTRGVSATIVTKAIGIYQGPTIASATAGQLIEVLILSAYSEL